MLAFLTLVLSAAGDEESRGTAGARWAFHSAHWPSLHYWEQVLIPSSCDRSLESLARAGSLPFKCMYSLLPTPESLPRGTKCCSHGPVWVPVLCGLQTEAPCCLQLCCRCRCLRLFPSLCSDSASGVSSLCPSQVIPDTRPSAWPPALLWSHRAG